MNLKQLVSNRSLLWLAVALAALLLLLLLGGQPQQNASREEERMAQVLGMIEGAGKVEVALFYAPDETGRSSNPTGAVVVAQGADVLPVRLELIRAVRTLLGLPEAAVDVFAMDRE